ncbi:hypothetical protein [Desulfitobacterium sp. LBE]|uniref:hypothetical protein n=1 Tax=Desulfitobacterium sp. LBE TaxID=884086 RepID=UPI0011A01556|nr:hypothetical protein [Desulfitobacterium sp. LBE]
MNLFRIRTKKQSRAKRTFIGRVDPDTGEILPIGGRGRKNQETTVAVKRGPVPSHQTAGKFFRTTYLFDAIGENSALHTI